MNIVEEAPLTALRIL